MTGFGFSNSKTESSHLNLNELFLLFCVVSKLAESIGFELAVR